MATYARSGQAIIWHEKGIEIDPDRNFPTLEEILEAAYKEFPDRHPADLRIFSCGDAILMERK